MELTPERMLLKWIRATSFIIKKSVFLWQISNRKNFGKNSFFLGTSYLTRLVFSWEKEKWQPIISTFSSLNQNLLFYDNKKRSSLRSGVLFRNLFRNDFFKNIHICPYFLNKGYLKLLLLLDKYKSVFFDSKRFATLDSEKFPRCCFRYSFSGIFIFQLNAAGNRHNSCWSALIFFRLRGHFFHIIWILVD